MSAGLRLTPPAANIQPESTVTGPDGRYLLDGVDLGEISVRAFLDGYAHQARELSSPEEVDGANFVPAPAKTCRFEGSIQRKAEP